MSWGQVASLHVVVVALADLEAGGGYPGAGFQPVAPLAQGGPEVEAEAELSRLQPEGLVRLRQLMAGGDSGGGIPLPEGAEERIRGD